MPVRKPEAAPVPLVLPGPFEFSVVWILVLADRKTFGVRFPGLFKQDGKYDHDDDKGRGDDQDSSQISFDVAVIRIF